MSAHSELAHQAARAAADADDQKEATANGLAAVTFALLDVADAIREASESSKKTNPLNTSREW